MESEEPAKKKLKTETPGEISENIGAENKGECLNQKEVIIIDDEKEKENKKDKLQNGKEDEQKVEIKQCVNEGGSLEENDVILIDDDNEEKKEIKADNLQIKDNNREAERKVGMELCLNDIQFQGIVKQRYSDFVVRECDIDGNLVFLTDTSHLDIKKEVTNYSGPPARIPPCPIEDEELLQKIEMFAKSEEEDKEKTMEMKICDDKEQRKLIHIYIKAKYENIGE